MVGSLQQTQFSSSQFRHGLQSLSFDVFWFSSLHVSKPPQARFPASLCDILYLQSVFVFGRMVIYTSSYKKYLSQPTCVNNSVVDSSWCVSLQTLSTIASRPDSHARCLHCTIAILLNASDYKCFHLDRQSVNLI